MKKIKKVLLILAGLLLLLVIAIAIFINSLKPDYSGKKALDGLQSEVNVYFDTYGIPHVYADNEKDALRALGYVHAQDRAAHDKSLPQPPCLKHPRWRYPLTGAQPGHGQHLKGMARM